MRGLCVIDIVLAAIYVLQAAASHVSGAQSAVGRRAGPGSRPPHAAGANVGRRRPVG